MKFSFSPITISDNIATYAASLRTNALPENQRVILVNNGDKRNACCIQLSSRAPFVRIEFGAPYVIVSIIVTFKGDHIHIYSCIMNL